MSVVDTVLPLGGGQDGKSPLFIPAGTTVGWNLYTIQRRTDLYGDDAEEFKPERWETRRPGWEYLPFNGGPRICLGRKSIPCCAVKSRLMQLTSDVDRTICSYRGFIRHHPTNAGVQRHRQSGSKSVDRKAHDHMRRPGHQGCSNT